MVRYFNGGYYLIKRKPIDFGADKGKLVDTCSRCINFSIFDNWCFGWMNIKLDDNEKAELKLTDEKIKEIHNWTDGRFKNGSNVLPDEVTAREFRGKFFNSIEGIEIFSLWFSDVDTELLIDEFREGNRTTDFNLNGGDFGLRKNLMKKIEEKEDNSVELLGFDLIGIEHDGSFHSFYCHDITNTLIDRFSLKLNSKGLFEEPQSASEIRQYLNDPKTGLKPVPWFISKVKRKKLE